MWICVWLFSTVHNEFPCVLQDEEVSYYYIRNPERTIRLFSKKDSPCPPLEKQYPLVRLQRNYNRVEGGAYERTPPESLKNGDLADKEVTALAFLKLKVTFRPHEKKAHPRISACLNKWRQRQWFLMFGIDAVSPQSCPSTTRAPPIQLI